jgi:DNA-binding NtrC family response regulator
LELPPLRERLDDIPLLVDHFVGEFAKANNKSVTGVDEEALRALTAYRWQGNVRELRNVIERAVIVCAREVISPDDLAPSVKRPSTRASRSEVTDAGVALPVGTTVEQAEKSLILRTLQETGHNKTRAAEILGISLKTLHNKLKKYREQT